MFDELSTKVLAMPYELLCLNLDFLLLQPHLLQILVHRNHLLKLKFVSEFIDDLVENTDPLLLFAPLASDHLHVLKTNIDIKLLKYLHKLYFGCFHNSNGIGFLYEPK